MTSELRGTGAAPGVAIGAPWIHRPVTGGGNHTLPIPEAASVAAAELERLASSLREGGHETEAEILNAQAMMAQDPELIDATEARIAAGTDAMTAILASGEEIAAVFAAMDDETLAARAADVRDVAQRIARHVAGLSAPRLERRSIVVAEDLAPSVTVELDRSFLAGIVLQGGSRTSHAAILARSLGIPAVVGVPEVMERVTGVGELAIDGDTGQVILDPGPDDRARLEAASRAGQAQRDADLEFRGRPLVTQDGHRVLLAANIGTPSEAAPAFAAGAEGIGLFRTEFAFAGRADAPSETEQSAAYRQVLDAAGVAPVTFRLADIGGDKPLAYVSIPPEANPFLGVRAIRLAAGFPGLFADQLRAILRASEATGRPASIMAPMVADAGDVELVLELIAAARRDIPGAPAPRTGIMVEIPSAVLLADELAARVDFMSIGTNDLTQYLLAADRTNAALSGRQDALHPAVLRAVRHVVDGARRGAGTCEVAVCGELAGDPVGAQLLIGLGVDELSMAPGSFNAVKRAVGGRSLLELREGAERAMTLSSARDVRAMMEAS